MKVNHSARTGGIMGISLSFSNMNVCCVFSLESPHQYKKKITRGYPKYNNVRNSRAKFEITVVNEPSEFEPLNFYCIMINIVEDQTADLWKLYAGILRYIWTGYA